MRDESDSLSYHLAFGQASGASIVMIMTLLFVGYPDDCAFTVY